MLPLKTKVLVIDDNASDRVIVRKVLQRIGYNDVQQAEDGKVADSKMANAVEMGSPFGLVIVDWNMPGVGGQKVIQNIRASRETRQAKIIVMTATAEVGVVEAAILNGADDFVVKPITLNVLKEKLEKFE